MSARRLSPLRKGRGLKKVEVVGGRFHTFLCERKNILFLLRVKYVFDFLRPPLPSFSGFFALFGGSLVEVGGSHLQTFLCERKISRRFYSPASQSQLYSTSRRKSYGVS